MLLSSINIRHSTARPIHQSHPDARVTQSVTNAVLFRLGRQCHISTPRHIRQGAPVGNLMRTAGWAAFRSRPSLRLFFSSRPHPHSGTPLGPRGISLATSLERRYRKRPMAETVTPVHRCEESLPFEGICTTYRTLPSGACRRKGDRSLTRPAETVFGGHPSIKTGTEGHWEVHCSTTALRSLHHHFQVGERGA